MPSDPPTAAGHDRPGGHRLAVALPLLVFAALLGLRMPQIIYRARFWAEEGQVFFHNAWTLPLGQALFTSFGGYLNLTANAATLAARWALPLPLAPYLTILTALLVQLCPPLLLLTAQDRWLHARRVRWAAILLVLLVPASEEIWLQTLHCQFELTLCCAIILALNPPSGRLAALHLGMLALAPLCGPTAIALLPLFAWRALRERSRGRAIQTAVLGGAAGIQLLLFFHAVPGRGYALDPLVLLCVVTIRHLAVPFLGVGHAQAVSASIRAARIAGYVPPWAIIAPIVAIGALATGVARQPGARAAGWLLAAAILVGGASYFGAIGGSATLIDPRAGERYVFVPQALLGLAVLALAATSSLWIGRVSWLIVVWLLVLGGWDYFHPWPIVSHGPSWRKEVAAWRADPGHTLRIWPAGWHVDLAPGL